jgi:hypothetical protein
MTRGREHGGEWTGPPPKPGYTAFRVLKAVSGLTAGQKLVWEEMRAMWNGPEGCFLSADHLAERVGQSKDNLERIRRELSGYGLLVSRRLDSRRTGWFVSIPADAIPRSSRPSPDEIRDCAAVVEEQVAQSKRGVAQYAPRRMNGQAHRGVARADTDAHRGVAGDAPIEVGRLESRVENSHLPEVGDNPPSSQKAGVFASEQDQGGEAGAIEGFNRIRNAIAQRMAEPFMNDLHTVKTTAMRQLRTMSTGDAHAPR